eukprot:2029493-Pleurochrysis_carterae.AAC.1
MGPIRRARDSATRRLRGLAMEAQPVREHAATLPSSALCSGAPLAGLHHLQPHRKGAVDIFTSPTSSPRPRTHCRPCAHAPTAVRAHARALARARTHALAPRPHCVVAAQRACHRVRQFWP